MKKARRNRRYKMYLAMSSLSRKSGLAASFFAAYLKHKDKDGKNEAEMDSLIKKYNVAKGSPDEIKSDIWKSMATNLISANEYFLYHFYEKEIKDRIPFVGNTEKRFLCRLLNVHSPWMIFGDKWQTYGKFGKYYNRKCMHITSVDDEKTFIDFCSKNKRTIAKIVRGDSGKQVFDINSSEKAKSFFEETVRPVLEKEGVFIAEEYIESHPEMKAFNPSSLNTIRIATFAAEGKVQILFAVFRIGRAGSIVDNAASGGMCAPINLESGKCELGASTERMDYFEKHPDSGKMIKGFVIPNWAELVSLAKELALIVPEQKYVSWDMALTDGNKWSMVEGNSEGDIILPQIAWQKGIRDIIKDTLYRNI